MSFRLPLLRALRGVGVRVSATAVDTESVARLRRLDLDLAAAGIGWDRLLSLVLDGEPTLEEVRGQRWVRRRDLARFAGRSALAAIEKAERTRIRIAR